MHDLQLLAATFVFLVPASFLSIETALSVSIFEILAGILARNVFGMETFAFLKLAASFAGIVLTFLAGTEVDIPTLKTRLKQSLAVGSIGFFAPFLTILAYCDLRLHWTWQASQIGAIALSTTSLAVVYAVLVESRMTHHVVGKLTMAGCFVNDFLVALALSTLFVKPNIWTWVFATYSVLVIVLAPRVLPLIIQRYGDRVIEIECRVVFLVLLSLMVLGELGVSHAMLPSFVLGLVLAPMFEGNRGLQRRLRTVSFAFITPFFFFNSGLLLPLRMLVANLGLLLIFLGLKLAAKFVGIYPVARKAMRSGAMYLTLLLSTGLTMGTLTSTYGLERGIIDETQFALLLAAVVGSALIPTFIAQRWFQPDHVTAEALVGGDASIGFPTTPRLSPASEGQGE